MKMFERCKTCPNKPKFIPSAKNEESLCVGLGPIVTYDGSGGTAYYEGSSRRVEFWSMKCSGDIALKGALRLYEAVHNEPKDIVAILQATGCTSLRNEIINDESLIGVEPFNPDQSIVK